MSTIKENKLNSMYNYYDSILEDKSDENAKSGNTILEIIK